ncbi:MAG: fructose-bisphosphate aldolase [Anaerobacillus sp.]|uniref:fructose-bisphosphate aldolase n=1 Tax=Anaerobacillus sp. TaxID=1872506 RepID=UPI003918F0ED
MKKLWTLCFLIILLLLATACNNLQEPKITIEAIVSQLSEEEYDYVGTYGLEKPTKDDFRKFTFIFEVQHSTKFSRKVEFPIGGSWREAVNTIDNKERYWFGDGYEQNIDGENIAKYESEFVFYSKGLNDEDIRKAFNSIILELYLDAEEGESLEKEYIVSELVRFNNK